MVVVFRRPGTLTAASHRTRADSAADSSRNPSSVGTPSAPVAPSCSTWICTGGRQVRAPGEGPPGGPPGDPAADPAADPSADPAADPTADPAGRRSAVPSRDDPAARALPGSRCRSFSSTSAASASSSSSARSVGTPPSRCNRSTSAARRASCSALSSTRSVVGTDRTGATVGAAGNSSPWAGSTRAARLTFLTSRVSSSRDPRAVCSHWSSVSGVATCTISRALV